ncbi:hypothetical protein C6497_13300 [Candidatus Poribacteria bacterium]|nr:MAG: hypothetical protein C6497_13300 [Candidatus Poribacteria bacterium]
MQRAIEDVGITTVSITLVENVAKRIKPPRVLSVPFGFGHPLGEPNNPTLQHTVISEALGLLENNEPPPILKRSLIST